MLLQKNPGSENNIRSLSITIYKFSQKKETANREQLCSRNELYNALRERENDPVHLWNAPEEDTEMLQFGPCPHDGIIQIGSKMVCFDLPIRGLVYFHLGCVPPSLRKSC